MGWRILVCWTLLLITQHRTGVRSQEQQFAIHVINAPPETEQLELLPLAGSEEYWNAKRAREQEESRYVDSSSASEEGMWTVEWHHFYTLLCFSYSILLLFFPSGKNAYNTALRLVESGSKDKRS